MVSATLGDVAAKACKHLIVSDAADTEVPGISSSKAEEKLQKWLEVSFILSSFIPRHLHAKTL